MNQRSSATWLFSLLIVLTVWAASVGFRHDGMARGTYHNPYSIEQVKKMMRFHGTLSAKFDGRSWWYRSGKQWLRLDSKEAKRRCI